MRHIRAVLLLVALACAALLLAPSCSDGAATAANHSKPVSVTLYYESS